MTESRPRFAALTYTADLNGFGVKDIRGELSVDEARLLTERLEVIPDFGMTIPDVRSSRDAPLPRRCVWTTTPEGGIFWHLAPAGRDSTGRPGNFFVHGIIDRTPQLPDHQGQALPRPSAWIGSPDILQPFGGAASDAARLPDKERPDAGEEVTADTVVAHLLGGEDGARIHLLGALLDGIAARREGGPPVVLATQTVEDAAQWVGLVSHLVAPATARTLSWSLLENPGGSVAARAERLSLDLVCIRHDAIAEVDPGVRLLVDGAGGLEGPVGTSDWALLADAVLDWAEKGDDLRRADEISREVGCPAGTHLAWPLAMLVALEPERFPSAKEVADRVLLHSPSEIAQAPERYRQAVTEAVSSVLGGDLDAIYDHLMHATDRTGVTELLWREYLSQLTTRPERLLGDRPLPVPRVGIGAVASQDIDAVARWAASLDPQATDVPRAVLRVVDHLVGLGLSSADEGVVEPLRVLVEKYVEPGFGDHQSLVRRCGPLREETASLVVRPALGWAGVILGSPVGEAIDAETARWLAPSGVEPVVATPAAGSSPLDLAVVLSQTRGEARPVSEWLLEVIADSLTGLDRGPLAGRSAPLTEVIPVLLERAHAASPVTPAHLARLLPRLPEDLGEEWATRLLLQTPNLDPADIDMLAPAMRSYERPSSPALQASRELALAALAGPSYGEELGSLTSLAGLAPLTRVAMSLVRPRSWSAEVREVAAASLLAAACLEQCALDPGIDDRLVLELQLAPSDVQRGVAFLATALSIPVPSDARLLAHQRAMVAFAAVVERGGVGYGKSPLVRALLRPRSSRFTEEAPIQPLQEVVLSCDRSSWGKPELAAVTTVVDGVFDQLTQKVPENEAVDLCRRLEDLARELIKPRGMFGVLRGRQSAMRRQDQE